MLHTKSGRHNCVNGIWTNVMKKVLLPLHGWGNWISRRWPGAMEQRPGSGRTQGLKALDSQQVLGKKRKKLPQTAAALTEAIGGLCHGCSGAVGIVHQLFLHLGNSSTIQRNTRNDIKSGGRARLGGCGLQGRPLRSWNTKSPGIQCAAMMDVCRHAPEKKGKTLNLPARGDGSVPPPPLPYTHAT